MRPPLRLVLPLLTSGCANLWWENIILPCGDLDAIELSGGGVHIANTATGDCEVFFASRDDLDFEEDDVYGSDSFVTIATTEDDGLLDFDFDIDVDAGSFSVATDVLEVQVPDGGRYRWSADDNRLTVEAPSLGGDSWTSEGALVSVRGAYDSLRIDAPDRRVEVSDDARDSHPFEEVIVTAARAVDITSQEASFEAIEAVAEDEVEVFVPPGSYDIDADGVDLGSGVVHSGSSNRRITLDAPRMYIGVDGTESVSPTLAR